MKKSALFLASLWLFGASEPSAFEAGDLNSKNPYGLTPTEKHIYNNTQDIKRLKDRLYLVEQKVSSLTEKLDGLKSVVEGIDERLNALKKNNELQTQILALKHDLNQSIVTQQENYAKIEKVLKEMSSLVDKISSSYVTKEELQEAIQQILEQNELAKKSGAELYKEAKRAYRKHHYEEAKKLFLLSAKKHYRPATSHFYIGESCYYQKNYSCAIEHYKKSASLYQKSSFMPTLLLHTAISLERVGQKEEAKRFYRSLIRFYPKTKAARIAKRNLKKLR